MIDVTIVRAHACEAGYKKDTVAQEALGRIKGGFTTKIHALVDALGNTLKFILTPCQRNDITHAEAFIASLDIKGVRLSFLQKEIEKCKEIMMSIFIKSGI